MIWEGEAKEGVFTVSALGGSGNASWGGCEGETKEDSLTCWLSLSSGGKCFVSGGTSAAPVSLVRGDSSTSGVNAEVCVWQLRD